MKLILEVIDPSLLIPKMNLNRATTDCGRFLLRDCSLFLEIKKVSFKGTVD